MLRLAGLLSGPGLTLSAVPMFLAERSCFSSRTRLSNRDTLSVTAEQPAKHLFIEAVLAAVKDKKQ